MNVVAAKKSLPSNAAWLPNAEQFLLLRTALGEDYGTAVGAWRKWQKNYSFADLNQAARRLLPLIYQNLTRFNFADETMPALRLAHRQTFRENQILFREIENAIALLAAANIRVLLLKGAALSRIYYGSAALRPMNDVDLLIEPKNVSPAIEVLQKHGWQMPGYWNFALHREIAHAVQFVNPHGIELDLHWNLLIDCWNADQNGIFWESAVELQFGAAHCLALNPTDQLFHVCCHGARANANAPIRWIADALMILRGAQSEFDWQRLRELARTRRVSLALFAALQYLRDHFAAPVPAEFLRKLAAAPITKMEKAVFQILTEPQLQPWKLRRYAAEIALKFSTLRASTTLRPRSLAFVRYLQYCLRAEKPRQLPVQLSYWIFRRLRSTIETDIIK